MYATKFSFLNLFVLDFHLCDLEKSNFWCLRWSESHPDSLQPQPHPTWQGLWAAGMLPLEGVSGPIPEPRPEPKPGPGSPRRDPPGGPGVTLPGVQAPAAYEARLAGTCLCWSAGCGGKRPGCRPRPCQLEGRKAGAHPGPAN